MKKEKFPVQLTALAGFMAVALAAYAEESATDLAPITVTASRTPVLLEHATGEVAVVTRKEIEARNVQRLTDTINLLPGVFTAPGKGVQQPSPGLALRGIPDDRRTLVLLDGLPLNDGFSGNSFLGGMPAGNIAQAEVLYGPMSSAYGGNAMGGVVNFVTRMPTATEFGFSVGYGDPFESGKGPEAVRKTLLTAGTRLENDLSVRITANWAATEGYRSDWVVASSNPTNTRGALPTSQKDGSPGLLLGKKGKNDWQEDGASIRLEQRLSDGARWRLGWFLQEYDFGFGSPETYLRSTVNGAPTYGPASTEASFAGNPGSYSRQLYYAGFDADLGGGRFNLLASYSDVAENVSVTPNLTNPYAKATGGRGRMTDSPAQTVNLDSYWTATFGAHDFTAGFAYRQDKADSRTYDLTDWSDQASKISLYSQAAGRTALTAGYLQDEWRFSPVTTLQAGLRYDHWRNDDGRSLDPNGSRTYEARTESAWSPKLGAAFRPLDSVTLRLSAGSAFRAPSVYDLYRSSKLSSYNTIANPALKPETVRTWEAGAEWRPWQGGEVRLTYFDNDIHDLIYLGPKDANNNRARINAGRAESRGVTLALSHRLDADSRIFANFTRTRSEIKENSAAPTSVGKHLTFLPEKQASVGFETRHGDWTLAASGRYASKQYSNDDNSDVAVGTYQSYDGYVVADAKLAYRIDRNFTASFAIDNLFDRDYFSYYAAPRRSWFAELSYKY